MDSESPVKNIKHRLDLSTANRFFITPMLLTVIITPIFCYTNVFPIIRVIIAILIKLTCFFLRNERSEPPFHFMS